MGSSPFRPRPIGWTYPAFTLASKRHYFIAGRSLCRRYGDTLTEGHKPGVGDPALDCHACIKALAKRENRKAEL